MHTMIDLETMGTQAGCAILSLGAVEFDISKNALGREFYEVISLRSNTDAGLSINADTVMWWLKQSDAARAALSQPTGGLIEVLTRFREWCNPNTYVWGHGADFDPPLLQAAYNACGLEAPWSRWRVLDTRTVLWRAGEKMGSHADAHNALSDARHQARRMLELLAPKP